MGAVGERVAIAPLARVEHLGAALRAGGGVGHHAGARQRSAGCRRMRNVASSGDGWLGARSIRSIRASGGASSGRLATSRAIASAGPHSRMMTPSPSLATQPRRPWRRASRHTVGRKPTPCTRPRTRINSATSRSPAGEPAGVACHPSSMAAGPVSATKRSGSAPSGSGGGRSTVAVLTTSSSVVFRVAE